MQMAREDFLSQPPANALLHPAQALRSELQNSVDKLKDSNRQLKEAIDDGDKDPELRISIGVIISLYVSMTKSAILKTILLLSLLTVDLIDQKAATQSYKILPSQG